MSIGKCGNDCAECTQSCAKCNGIFEYWDKTKKKYNINFSYFKPYFDVGMGKEVTSKKEIDDYCKQNNLIYAGDKEITEQCKINKRDNEIKQKEAFKKGLEKELNKVL